MTFVLEHCNFFKIWADASFRARFYRLKSQGNGESIYGRHSEVRKWEERMECTFIYEGK